MFIMPFTVSSVCLSGAMKKMQYLIMFLNCFKASVISPAVTDSYAALFFKVNIAKIFEQSYFF